MSDEKKHDDGGAAFARPCGESPEHYNRALTGMTISDRFAEVAYSRMVEAHINGKMNITREEIAIASYQYADAMIAEKRRREAL